MREYLRRSSQTSSNVVNTIEINAMEISRAVVDTIDNKINRIGIQTSVKVVSVIVRM